MAYKKYKSNSKNKISAEDKATKLIEKTNEKIKTFKHKPENVIEYLNFLSQFNQYSARNNMLIQEQREGSLAVATFPKFKELGYSVNRGEASMQILRPNIYEYFKKPDTGKIESVSKANEVEKKLIKEKKIPVTTKRTFSQMNVFDVTQTNMPKEEYPKIYPNAHIDFVFSGNDIDNFNTALTHYSTNELNIPVTIEHYNDLAKGKYYPLENRISLNDKNTPTENAHTLIHELSHSKMHNWKDIRSKDNALSTANVKEYQAEMATYVVAKHFGLDTEEHSVDYISGWTNNLNQIEDENLFDIYTEVSNTSKEMVTEISKSIEELGLEKGVVEMSDREQFKLEVKELIEEDEDLKFGESNEIIYKIDDINVYGGFEMGNRGADHNILVSDNASWENIIEWGTVVVPETSTYISNEPIEEFEELGYKNLPIDNNHIVGFKSESNDQKILYPEDTDEVEYCNLTGSPIGQEEAVYFCEEDLTYYKEKEIEKVLSERELVQLYDLGYMYYTDRYYDNDEVLVPDIPEKIEPRESEEELRYGIQKIFLQEYITTRIGLGTSDNFKEPLIEIAEPTTTFKKGEYFSSSELKKEVKTHIEKDPELAESPLSLIVKTNNSSTPNKQDNITKTTFKGSIAILEKEETKLNEKNNNNTHKVDLENER